MTDVDRRLAAVLAADVAGYSKLMGEDETGTLNALRQLRRELFDPQVERHRGQVVKRMGDGWLVEFASVVDALNGALEIQQSLADHPTIRLRMGLHIGDIVHEQEDIYGDGVNIATRLQELATPGAIVISDEVRRHAAGKVSAEFEELGPKTLKNIAEPILAHSWGGGGRADLPPPSLPDKPSIAVLPFSDMSGDPEQEYFVDGITEDIITQLARLRWLFVIARNSTFHYKDKSPDVREVARDLGVRYVLEGSVRRLGKQIRITAQLIDATTTSHIWAERFDRELVDIFQLQDELTQSIAAAVDTELAGNEQEMARKKAPAQLDVWDSYQRGNWHRNQGGKENVAEARVWYEKALSLDPTFAPAHGGLAYLDFFSVGMGYADDPAEALKQGYVHAEQALKQDERDYFNHFVQGRIFTYMGQGSHAIRALERAVELNPNSAQAYYGLGFALYWFGQAAEALPHIEQAIRLSPHDPFLWSFYFFRANCRFAIRKGADAIADYETAIELGKGEFWPYLSLASQLGYQSKTKDAQAVLVKALELRPDLTLTSVEAMVQNLYPEYLKRLIDGLRYAGLKE